MGSFNPIIIPKSITQFLGELSRIGSVNDKVSQVNDLVHRLQSETSKIEAFKRELPLCMLLINDGELMVTKNSSNAQPVLEEFIPLKNSFDNAKVEMVTNQEDNGDKKNWLSSTQLWNINESIDQKANSAAQMVQKKTKEEDANNSLISCFIPNVQPNIQLDSTMLAPPHHHTFRKQRRCWSGELHRLFVNALQQLGGSQVATPKQIRELMKVDGLTNDEVKSHLQKYRLHRRRIPSSKTSQSCFNAVGGSWMFKSCSSKSGSPDGPLLNGGNNIDDEDEKSENYCWSGNL